MHILINGSFWSQPNVGYGQYLRGLLRWLPIIAPQHRFTLLLPAAAGSDAPCPAGIATLRLRTPFDGRNANLAKLWFEQVSVPQTAHMVTSHAAAGSASQTILHVPYFAPPLRCAVPVVATIGDIIPLLLPEYRGTPQVRAYMALVARAARRTPHIITFSHHSRWDIATRLGIPARRITAIALAADERYQPQDRDNARARVAERYGLTGPFIYYVGGLDARKNVAILLRACARLRQQGHPFTAWVASPAGTLEEQPATLAIAGRALGGDTRLFPDLDALIAETRTGDIVRRIDVPFADGPLLYQACTFFVFPSRYEGFGLPPLEAMACGAPVIVSNASSLPEVVGKAALCVPPNDLDGWAAAFHRLLNDVTLRQDLSERGLAQAQQFSWRRVAEETVRVYEEVAETAGMWAD